MPLTTLQFQVRR
ncbi:hypothetical protein YPPY99_3636, partial [Yersinia pestis PY-99]